MYVLSQEQRQPSDSASLYQGVCDTQHHISECQNLVLTLACKKHWLSKCFCLLKSSQKLEYGRKDLFYSCGHSLLDTVWAMFSTESRAGTSIHPYLSLLSAGRYDHSVPKHHCRLLWGRLISPSNLTPVPVCKECYFSGCGKPCTSPAKPCKEALAHSEHQNPQVAPLQSSHSPQLSGFLPQAS